MPAAFVNGRGDSFWKRPDFQLWRARGLDLDLGSGYTAYCRASLIDLYLHAKFHWNRKNFLWMDGRTDGRIHRRTFEISLIRSTPSKSRPNKVLSHARHRYDLMWQVSHSVCLSLGLTKVPCKNGWTNRDDVGCWHRWAKGTMYLMGWRSPVGRGNSGVVQRSPARRTQYYHYQQWVELPWTHRSTNKNVTPSLFLELLWFVHTELVRSSSRSINREDISIHIICFTKCLHSITTIRLAIITTDFYIQLLQQQLQMANLNKKY